MNDFSLTCADGLEVPPLPPPPPPNPPPPPRFPWLVIMTRTSEHNMKPIPAPIKSLYEKQALRPFPLFRRALHASAAAAIFCFSSLETTRWLAAFAMIGLGGVQTPTG